MANREYTAIVTVSLVSPNGDVLGTRTEAVTLKVDMTDFETDQGVDDYMAGELSTMLSAGASNIEDCFG